MLNIHQNLCKQMSKLLASLFLLRSLFLLFYFSLILYFLFFFLDSEINVWYSILNRYLIGLFYEENLIDICTFSIQLPELMQNIPFYIKSIYFQQNNSLAHNARIIQNYLQDIFENHVISTYGSVR